MVEVVFQDLFSYWKKQRKIKKKNNYLVEVPTFNNNLLTKFMSISMLISFILNKIFFTLLKIQKQNKIMLRLFIFKTKKLINKPYYIEIL